MTCQWQQGADRNALNDRLDHRGLIKVGRGAADQASATIREANCDEIRTAAARQRQQRQPLTPKRVQWIDDRDLTYHPIQDGGRP